MCQKYDLPYKPVGTCKPFTPNNPYRFENIELLLSTIDKTVKLLNIEKDKNNKDILTLKCGCGNIFKRPRSCILRNHDNIICPQCFKKIRGQKNSIRKLQEKIKVIENMGYEILSDKNYIKSKDKLLIRTKEGYLCYTTYSLVKRGSGAAIFSLSYNKDNIVHNANVYCKNNNINLEVLSLVDGDFKQPHIKCKCECGNIFETNVYWLSYKTRCNKCAIKKSRWCLEVEKILKQNNISYKEEVKFNDCRDIFALPFDYQLDINNGLIEVDGEQHFSMHGFGRTREEKAQIYKRTVYHDKIKNEYCKKNNIPLLRISFKDVIDGSYKKKIEDFIHIKK